MAYKQNRSPLHQNIIGGMLSNAMAMASRPKSAAAGVAANNTPSAQPNPYLFDPILSGNTSSTSTAGTNTASALPVGFNNMAQIQVNKAMAMANAVKPQPKIVNNQSQTVKPQPAQPTVQAAQAPITKPNEVVPSPINPGLFSNMETIGKLNENTTFWGDRYKESF